ncbi:tnpR domain protein [Escherichia coli 6-175-07_S3_C3]|nr:tnpR domain protein [Escherichia coli 6-175-07_S3_C3]
MISLSPPTICNSALLRRHVVRGLVVRPECDQNQTDFCLRWLR